jgi:hypothetical protein
MMANLEPVLKDLKAPAEDHPQTPAPVDENAS